MQTSASNAKMITKFKVGQRVKISIPRNDMDYKYDEKIGTIERISTLSSDPEYTIKLADGMTPGIHFLEQDLELFSEKNLKDEYVGLICPACEKGVREIIIPDNNDKVKVVVFECLFSATFDVQDKVKDMQIKLNKAKKDGTLATGSFL